MAAPSLWTTLEEVLVDQEGLTSGGDTAADLRKMGKRVALVCGVTFALHFFLIVTSTMVRRCIYFKAYVPYKKKKQPSGSATPLLQDDGSETAEEESCGDGGGSLASFQSPVGSDGIVLDELVGSRGNRDGGRHSLTDSSRRIERTRSVLLAHDPLAAAHDIDDEDIWMSSLYLSSHTATAHEWQSRTFAKELGLSIYAAFLFTLSLSVCLVSNMLRRVYTDASQFDMKQMGWHSLTSTIDILGLLIINKFLARCSFKDLGWKMTSHRNRYSWGRRFVEMITSLGRRITVALVIAAGTHAITPSMYYATKCWGGWHPVDYKNSEIYKDHHGWLGVSAFFLVQQLCFFINALDEESNWRGFVNGVFCKYRLPLAPSMYIISGWNYAMVHSLNNMEDLSSFGIMVVNMTCEGALWMLLYRCSRDLWGNVWLHDIDDLFSIWFGGRSLAGYNLPAGQIIPFAIASCSMPRWVTGGDFGAGSGAIYSVQNIYTLCLIILLELIYFRWRHYTRCEKCGWKLRELRAWKS